MKSKLRYNIYYATVIPLFKVVPLDKESPGPVLERGATPRKGPKVDGILIAVIELSALAGARTPGGGGDAPRGRGSGAEGRCGRGGYSPGLREALVQKVGGCECSGTFRSRFLRV